MKKSNLVVAIILAVLSLSAIAVTFVVTDRVAPTINISGNPKIGCEVTLNQLLTYGSASDNRELKSFFIEENSLLDIADNRYVTYVAIDESNNVSKKKVNVNVDRDITTYHIEVLEPIKVQLRGQFQSSKYLALRNECGWDIKDTFIVDGVDYNTIGEYDVIIKSKSHPNVKSVFETVEVDDYLSPKIKLDSESHRAVSYSYFDDDYFLAFVEDIVDDKDSTNELKRKITCNWKDVLNADDDGYVRRVGTYTITYRVTDSDGNTGRANMSFILDVQ